MSGKDKFKKGDFVKNTINGMIYKVTGESKYIIKNEKIYGLRNIEQYINGYDTIQDALPVSALQLATNEEIEESYHDALCSISTTYNKSLQKIYKFYERGVIKND